MATWLSCIAILLFLHLQISAVQSFDPFTKFSKLDLPPGIFSPDSAFRDRHNRGPYVGVHDGRILRYNGSFFEDFAYISPNRTKEECDGVTNVTLRQKCGRAIAMSYHFHTEKLYILGAYGGLYEVGQQGGLATLLATEVNGMAFNYLTGLDLDLPHNKLYFTDQSLIYTYQEFVEGKPYPIGDSTGRLMEYDIDTGDVNVLVQGLPRPFGPAISATGEFILFSTRGDQRVYKYSIITGAAEVVLSNLPGLPWKVRRAPVLLPFLLDTFWVAVNVQQDGINVPLAYRFDSIGTVHLIKNLSVQFPNRQVIGVQEYYDQNPAKPKLYVGSALVTYLGIYST